MALRLATLLMLVPAVAPRPDHDADRGDAGAALPPHAHALARARARALPAPRSDFYFKANVTYFNPATLGPCPRVVVEKASADWALLEQNPADHYFGMWQDTEPSTLCSLRLASLPRRPPRTRASALLMAQPAAQ